MSLMAGSKSCRTAVVAPDSSFALSALSGSDRDSLIDFVVDYGSNKPSVYLD